ncbi:MAG TPA: ATP-grasp domain-containing protein, partial [Thermomicrobiales bacterium]|nr:ATP-grasp domain-containing protein [Thermomicrobiales bacterium]
MTLYVADPKLPWRDGDGHIAEPSLRTPLGILGGGQLARMTIEAASALGIDVVVADLKPGSPASRVAAGEVVFPLGWDDEAAIVTLARRTPTITLESEFVDASVLERLRALGCDVWTSPESLRIVQDKLLQKQALAAAAIAVAPFRAVEKPSDVVAFGREAGWPLLLKTRRDGYDGYGNTLVQEPDDAAKACSALGWPARRLLAEAFVTFERELAVIIVRGQDGEEVNYPVVETQQDPERHICRVVLAPAPILGEVAARTSEMAVMAVRAVGGVGTFGVEMFQLADGSVLVNELAPRPHNSGHYSIEACVTSQFANHMRAVLGLPLGDPAMRAPA